MKKAPIPKNEKERLKALKNINALNNAKQESLDQITDLATYIFNVSISLIAFVEKDEVIFKSVHGLNQKKANRSVSFCGHTINTDDVFVVEDTAKDKRFADNPAVTGDMAIRFYAGAPIYSVDGYKVGTFFILDKKSKKLSKKEKDLLLRFASWIGYEINFNKLSEINKKFKNLEKKEIEKEDELQKKNQLLSATLESIGDGVITTDIKGKITALNYIAENLTGWKEKNAIGKSVEDVFNIVSANKRKILKNPVKKVLKTGKGVTLSNHTVLISKENERYQIADSCSPIKGKNNEVLGVVLVFRDVTKDYKRKEDLIESKNKLTLAMKLASLVDFELDILKKEFTFNDRFYNFYNTSAKREGGYNMSVKEYNDNFIPPDEQSMINQNIEKALKVRNANYEGSLEHRIVQRGGHIKHVSTRYKLEKDENGKTVKLYGAIQDITEAKELENKLKKSYEKLKRITDNVTDIVFTTDMNFQTTYISPSVKRVTGFSVEEQLNKKPEEKFPPSSVNKMRKFMKRELEKDRDPRFDKNRTNYIEVEEYTASGDLINVEINYKFIRDENGNPIGAQGVLRDITKRKKLEKDLYRFKKLSDSAMHAIYIVDKNIKIEYVNPAFERVTGYKKDEVIGKNPKILKSGKMSKDYYKKLWNTLLSKKSWEEVVINKKKNGKFYHAYQSISPILDEENNNNGFVAIQNDITERVEMEKQIKENNIKIKNEKDKLDKIIKNIGDGVFVVNKDNKIILFNQKASKISGYKPKEVIGKNYKNILKFVFDDDKKINNDFIDRVFITGKEQEIEKETSLIDKNKKLVPVADSASPLLDEDGNVYACIVIFRDVTEERRIEKSKTEFVSLASHQLKTPLGSINWNTEMLLSEDYGKIGEEPKEVIKEMHDMNERMIKLVDTLLNVSRIEMGKLNVAPKKVDLKNICEDVLTDIKPFIKKKKHKVVKSYNNKEVPKISVDPKLMQIVMLNFISNAAKYTPDNGRIKINFKIKNDEIIFSVANNGYPIPRSEQDMIFGRMFRASNAKSVDTNGDGLGLYLVKLIADSSGGKTWFKSEKNKDTVFYFSLPLSGMKKNEGKKSLI